MMEWLAMGGYGGYVWGAYGVAVIAIGAECIALVRRRRRAFARARAEAEVNHGD
ncbi:MAG: heme exporter protein CcmD [Burkholderiales bacterium]|nr:heme exporter protein CcmD [Burkholderiales bacterium]